MNGLHCEGLKLKHGIASNELSRFHHLIIVYRDSFVNHWLCYQSVVTVFQLMSFNTLDSRCSDSISSFLSNINLTNEWERKRRSLVFSYGLTQVT